MGHSDGNGGVQVPSGRKYLGAVSLAKAGQSPCGVDFNFSPRKILRVLRWYFEHQRRVEFEGCGGAAPDHHGNLAKVKVELHASTHCNRTH